MQKEAQDVESQSSCQAFKQKGEKRARANIYEVEKIERAGGLCSPKTERDEIDSRDPDPKERRSKKGIPKWEETKRSRKAQILRERGVEPEKKERNKKERSSPRRCPVFAGLRSERRKAAKMAMCRERKKRCKMLQKCCRNGETRERRCESKDDSEPVQDQKNATVSRSRRQQTGRQ